MTEKAPAFQFYPKDYQTDGKVRMMSWEARGVYMDLLCTYWLEGTLPADPARLGNMVGMTPRRFAALWPQIAPCFEVHGSTLRQKRLDRERAKQKAYSEAQSEKGKKGGKPPKINEEEKPEVNRAEAEPKPEQSFPFPFASSSALPTEHESRAEREVVVRDQPEPAPPGSSSDGKLTPERLGILYPDTPQHRKLVEAFVALVERQVQDAPGSDPKAIALETLTAISTTRNGKAIDSLDLRGITTPWAAVTWKAAHRFAEDLGYEIPP